MIIKRIMIFLEVIMTLWFIAPFFSGIINAGNLTGLFLCGILFLITVFSGKVSKIILHLWESLPGKLFVIAASIVVAAAAIFMVSITALMIHAQTNYPREPANVIVLGCKVNGEQPSKMLRMRLEAAEKYLNENEEVLCVVSGGKGSDESISEAQAMKNFLVEKGIDEKRVIMEDKSNNTRENLEFSTRMLKDIGEDKEIAIVTDGFHQYRASLVANELGFKAYAISAKIANPALLPTYYVREWLAIAREYAEKIIK